MNERTWAAIVCVGAVALSLGCKRSNPPGHLARTDAPTQQSKDYPDQTSDAWDDKMNLDRGGSSHTFFPKELGTLHVWLDYYCPNIGGDIKIGGTVGYSVGGKVTDPVPFTVSTKGATVSLPRGKDDAFVTEKDGKSKEGRPLIGGYVYLFDVEATDILKEIAIKVTLSPEQTKCGGADGFMMLRVYKD